MPDCLTLLALDGVPMVRPNDDLAAIVDDAIAEERRKGREDRERASL